jgi:hypothetical protein
MSHARIWPKSPGDSKMKPGVENFPGRRRKKRRE